jgi:hypothetical protein
MSHTKDVLLDIHHNEDGRCSLCALAAATVCETCGRAFGPVNSGDKCISVLGTRARIICRHCYEQSRTENG